MTDPNCKSHQKWANTGAGHGAAGPPIYSGTQVPMQSCEGQELGLARHSLPRASDHVLLFTGPPGGHWASIKVAQLPLRERPESSRTWSLLLLQPKPDKINSGNSLEEKSLKDDGHHRKHPMESRRLDREMVT